MDLLIGLLPRLGVSLLPVFLFLGALIILDSFKLVALRAILVTIVIGWIAAILSYFVNSMIIEQADLSLVVYSRYCAPLTEELLKSLYVFYLIRTRRVGFMVDAALYGFAVGAGFAFVENIFYLQQLGNASLMVWVIRGFGTAVMHGGTSAIFAVISKNRVDRRHSMSIVHFIPGFLVAVALHSFFNHLIFLLHPIGTTLIILVSLPLALAVIYTESEKATRHWLGVGFDTDMELLQMILAGNIAQTRIGLYLQTLQQRFAGEVVADILCYLRIYLELSIRAKSLLMMREAGLPPPQDASDIKEKFGELKYLQKTIGATGVLALHPFIHTTSRDLWQLNMLEQQ
jgi:RsiW-degrading membrane proteinase PrsW (M82 family)